MGWGQRANELIRGGQNLWAEATGNQEAIDRLDRDAAIDQRLANETYATSNPTATFIGDTATTAPSWLLPGGLLTQMIYGGLETGLTHDGKGSGWPGLPQEPSPQACSRAPLTSRHRGTSAWRCRCYRQRQPRSRPTAATRPSASSVCRRQQREHDPGSAHAVAQAAQDEARMARPSGTASKTSTKNRTRCKRHDRRRFGLGASQS